MEAYLVAEGWMDGLVDEMNRCDGLVDEIDV